MATPALPNPIKPPTPNTGKGTLVSNPFHGGDSYGLPALNNKPNPVANPFGNSILPPTTQPTNLLATNIPAPITAIRPSTQPIAPTPIAPTVSPFPSVQQAMQQIPKPNGAGASINTQGVTTQPKPVTPNGAGASINTQGVTTQPATTPTAQPQDATDSASRIQARVSSLPSNLQSVYQGLDHQNEIHGWNDTAFKDYLDMHAQGNNMVTLDGKKMTGKQAAAHTRSMMKAKQGKGGKTPPAPTQKKPKPKPAPTADTTDAAKRIQGKRTEAY